MLLLMYVLYVACLVLCSGIVVKLEVDVVVLMKMLLKIMRVVEQSVPDQ